jgi:cyclopropane fatty-acyl-phospholipid synthase-like methyltransferase
MGGPRRNLLESFAEAQMQALIAVLELSRSGQRADAENLTNVGYFRQYRQDWTEALSTFADQGLLACQEGAYILTKRGSVQAERLREARPPFYYWYKDYYQATRTSAAYAEFCERVFGRDFSQHGFSDMAQVDVMLARLNLGPKDRVLDLGCGNGAMAEYIAQETGARVSGIDYIPEAIRQAKERAESRPDRLSFYVGDIGHLVDAQGQLPFRPHSFDALIAVDTLYFGDLKDTLRQMRCLLAPGGQMALFYGHNRYTSEGEFDPATLAPQRTPLGEALQVHDLRCETLDFSRADYEHAQLKKVVLEELRPALEAEGNLFLFENRYGEARGAMRLFEAGESVRYLYHVRGIA